MSHCKLLSLSLLSLSLTSSMCDEKQIREQYKNALKLHTVHRQLLKFATTNQSPTSDDIQRLGERQEHESRSLSIPLLLLLSPFLSVSLTKLLAQVNSSLMLISVRISSACCFLSFASFSVRSNSWKTQRLFDMAPLYLSISSLTTAAARMLTYSDNECG